MKLFVINEEKPERDISLLAFFIIPPALALLFQIMFSVQIYTQSAFAYFSAIVMFIAYFLTIVYENRNHNEFAKFLMIILYYGFTVIELVAFGYAYKDPAKNPQAGYYENTFMYIALCYITGVFVVPILLTLLSLFFVGVLLQGCAKIVQLYFTLELFLLTFLALLSYQVFAGPRINDFKIQIVFIWYFVLVLVIQGVAIARRQSIYNLILGLFNHSYLTDFSNFETVLLIFYYVFVILGFLLTLWFGQEPGFPQLRKDAFAHLAIAYYLTFTVVLSVALIAYQIGQVSRIQGQNYKKREPAPEQMLSEARSSSSQEHHRENEQRLLPPE